jgi:hypothetical protein
MLKKTIGLAAFFAFVMAVGELFSAEQFGPNPVSARVRALEESLDRGVPGAERAHNKGQAE